MNWREYISNLYNLDKSDESVEFYPPSSGKHISAVELSLNVILPSPLKELLMDTNGIMILIKLGEKTIKTGWLIWPLEEIAKENSFFRTRSQKETYGRQFDDLLFFANVGVDGILFAYKTSAKRDTEPDIYVWHPIDNTLTRKAPSLEIFIEQWVTGKIFV